MFGRTVGPAKLIFGHKMYIWCRSDIGYMKKQISQIWAPCWEFLIFAKNQEILIFRKSGQKGAIFMKSLPKWKDWILRPYGLYMQKIRPQKPAKQLGGIFFYMPILLYNTNLSLVIAVGAHNVWPDGKSDWADFRTQNVFMVPLWLRLFKNSKFQNLGTLLGISHFCQKSRNPDF